MSEVYDCLQRQLSALCEGMAPALENAGMPHYGLGGVRVVLSGDPGVRSWRWVGAPGEKLEVTLGDYGRDEQASLLEQCVKEALTLDFRYVEPPLRACKVPAIPNPMPI